MAMRAMLSGDEAGRADAVADAIAGAVVLNFHGNACLHSIALLGQSKMTWLADAGLGEEQVSILAAALKDNNCLDTLDVSGENRGLYP